MRPTGCWLTVCRGRGGLDKVVAFRQESAGGFEIEAALDRYERQQCMQREGDDATEQSPGDTHCEAPVFEVGDSLLPGVGGVAALEG